MLRIRFLKKLANILFYIGKFDATISVLEKLVEIFDRIKDGKKFGAIKKAFMSDCCAMLAALYEQQGYSDAVTKKMRAKSLDVLQ
jgi:hypothetical protein